MPDRLTLLPLPTTPARPIAVIKAVRAITGLDLRGSKDIVDALHHEAVEITLRDGEDVAAAVRDLAEQGVTAEILPADDEGLVMVPAAALLIVADLLTEGTLEEALDILGCALAALKLTADAQMRG